jgi:hypothetical protein
MNVGMAPTTAVELMAWVGWDAAPDTMEAKGMAVGFVASSEKETVERAGEIDVTLADIDEPAEDVVVVVVVVATSWRAWWLRLLCAATRTGRAR